jgi:thiamine phosphate synthase YjbQ (UPF0047 family)
MQYSGLLSILVNETQYEDNAEQILEQVKSVFPKSQHGKQSKHVAVAEKNKNHHLKV